MSNYQKPVVIFPNEFNKENTKFGEIEPFGKLGGQKISISYVNEEGEEGGLVVFPQHWGRCFGIKEVKPFEDGKEKEEDKKDEMPKYDITYVVDNDSTYDAKNEKPSDEAAPFVDMIENFTQSLIEYLQSDDVIDELPSDIQMKLKNPETERTVLRPILVYPNKTETVTKKGKSKEVKMPDKSKPPRIYGIRVLKTKKGVWYTEFQKASSKDEDATYEPIDPNSLMDVACSIRPGIKLDYLFVKENKLCLQLRLIEAIVIPFTASKMGGLLSKKMGFIKPQDEDTTPEQKQDNSHKNARSKRLKNVDIEEEE